MFEKLTKTKDRIRLYAEVNTNNKTVNNILDLVKDETYNIESRFLEPACGDGNFLTEIFSRKLKTLSTRYSKNKTDYEKYSILSVGSIYGIDILKDNVRLAREKLLNNYINQYKKIFTKTYNNLMFNSVEFILSKNIIHGNAVNLKDSLDNNIVFYEWSLINTNFVKIREFEFSELLANQKIEGPNLFSDLGDSAFIPKSIKEYKPIHYLQLTNVK